MIRPGISYDRAFYQWTRLIHVSHTYVKPGTLHERTEKRERRPGCLELERAVDGRRGVGVLAAEHVDRAER